MRRNVFKDLEEYRQMGMSEEDAFREATFRVFGCPPGTYGAGVAELVESKNWETQADLGNNYIRYSSHAYGRGSYGKQKPDVYRRHLARMDVTVKNEDSREYDMMSCTDYYNYYGGMIVAAKTVRGSLPLPSWAIPPIPSGSRSGPPSRRPSTCCAPGWSIPNGWKE